MLPNIDADDFVIAASSAIIGAQIYIWYFDSNPNVDIMCFTARNQIASNNDDTLEIAAASKDQYYENKSLSKGIHLLLRSGHYSILHQQNVNNYTSSFFSILI